jgi:circadian clock protein KaiC
MKKPALSRIETGVRNLDALLHGGLPKGSVSVFGVEETVVDGVILLSATEEGAARQRYLDVYKLRNTAHATGRHEMAIGAGGITVSSRGSKAKPRPHRKQRRRS